MKFQINFLKSHFVFIYPEFFKELDIIRIERNSEAAALQESSSNLFSWSTANLPFLLLILLVPILLITLIIISLTFCNARYVMYA